MTSFKLAVASISVASVLLACTAATLTDDVDVDVEASQVETNACPKPGGCLPPSSPSSTCVAPDGGPTGVTFPGSMVTGYDLTPVSTSSGGVKVGGVRQYGTKLTAVTGDLTATASPSTTGATATNSWTTVSGGLPSSSGLVYEAQPGQQYGCTGTTKDGLTLYVAEDPVGSGIWKCFAGCQDTSSSGTPHGFTAITVYTCPPAYPVNRCTPWGNSCTCTSQ